MIIATKKQINKPLSESYLEHIILKLDRVEAELETVKAVIFGYTKKAHHLDGRIEQLEQKAK